MMHFLEDGSVARVRDAELIRAARHYRRAISALGESTFESLNPITAKKLRDHLEREMTTVVTELNRRGLSVTEAPATPHVDAPASTVLRTGVRMPEVA